MIKVKKIINQFQGYELFFDSTNELAPEVTYLLKLELRGEKISFYQEARWENELTLSCFINTSSLIIDLENFIFSSETNDYVWDLYIVDKVVPDKKIRIGKELIEDTKAYLKIENQKRIQPYFTANDNMSIEIKEETEKLTVQLSECYWNADGLVLEGICIVDRELMKEKLKYLFLIKNFENTLYDFEFTCKNNNFSITLPYDLIADFSLDTLQFTIRVNGQENEVLFDTQPLYIEGQTFQQIDAVRIPHKLVFSNTGEVSVASLSVKIEPATENSAGFLAKVKDKIEKRKRLKYKQIFASNKKNPFSETTYIFESFGGRQYSDSPKAIYEQLILLKPDAKIFWSIEKEFEKEFKKNNIPYIIKDTVKWAVFYSRAHYWVTNARLPLWFKKNAHTKYIQTWHGTPLKKLGLDIDKVTMPGTTTARYKKNFVNEAKKWDLLTSPNHYSTKIFRSAFGYKGNIMEIGYPRNDKLVNNNNDRTIEMLKNKLGIPTGKKVILYAPTWRDNDYITKGKYSFKIPFDIDKLQQELGEDYVVLFRMHYLIANELDLSPYGMFTINVSSYPDISDLYLVSDLLVTDYSSVFFDYSILKRPTVFYAYDLASYKDDLRGFYLNYYEDLPGGIAQNTDELLKEVKLAMQTGSNGSRINEFYSEFCTTDDGFAAKKVAKYLIRE